MGDKKMKTKMLLGTLVAMALAAGQGQATTLPLKDVTITASYQGDPSGMQGVSHQYGPGPGSNIDTIDPAGLAEPEFITSDFNFIVDFAENGLLTVYNNAPITPGAYTMRFDFGATLGAALTSYTLVDASTIGGLPLLTLLNGNSIGLDLSGVTWAGPDGFGSFSVQLAAAAVPEPASAALLLAGLSALALARRKARPVN